MSTIKNFTDQNGNEGFGMWLRYPTTTTWFFLTGDINANPLYGTSGFLKAGTYYIGWKGQYQWWTFDENGYWVN